MTENSDTFPEKEMVGRATSGDQVALTVLLTRIHDRLRAHLTGRIPRDVQPGLDVDDLLQETQIRVFQNISSFQWIGPEAFYRWVATIALRHLRNGIAAQRTLKRGRAQTRTLGAAHSSSESMASFFDWIAGPEDSPSRHASSLEAGDALAAALEGLPEHYHQAVRLVYLEGRSVDEAARIMGRSNRAIHNLCYKAKELLHLSMGSTSRFFSRP